MFFYAMVLPFSNKDIEFSYPSLEARLPQD